MFFVRIINFRMSLLFRKTWFSIRCSGSFITILFTKTNAAQTEDALSYYRVRGIYFLAVAFMTTIILCNCISDILSLEVTV